LVFLDSAEAILDVFICTAAKKVADMVNLDILSVEEVFVKLKGCRNFVLPGLELLLTLD
jgi:hypothetical protein